MQTPLGPAMLTKMTDAGWEMVLRRSRCLTSNTANPANASVDHFHCWHGAADSECPLFGR